MLGTRTRNLLIGAAATTVAAAGVVAPARAGNLNPLQAAQLGLEAFTYGYPLTEIVRVRTEMTSVACPDRYGNAPTNTFSNAGGFPRPQDQVVVAPNVDTLYSIAHLDLTDGPVVLGHPDMGDRYFVFQLVDPATNTLGYIGLRTTGSAAGRFAIRWTGSSSQGTPEGTTPIDVPSRHIWIIGRTLAGDAQDQAVAQALMNEFTLTPPGGALDVAGCTPGAPVKPQAKHGVALLDAISEATELDAPPARDDAQLARLKAIGVGPGLRVADARLGWLSRTVLDSTVKWAERSLAPAVTAQQYVGMLKANGWTAPPLNIGDYGTDYLTRAGVAQIGLGANTEEEAAYRTAFLDSRGVPLNGNGTYRLRFAAGEEPPAEAFWSVTVYNSKGFLPEVPERRHAVGSSRPPLLRQPDGSVEIQFSAEPPADDSVNWLPVPEGRFRVYLRVYSPSSSVLERSWRPPGIERIR